VTQDETAAQAELRDFAKELSTLCLRLEAFHDKLPVPPQETAMLSGEVEMTVELAMRNVIECVLHDRLRPAVRDLQDVATNRPTGEEGE
jgi:hypothetical protein